MKSINLTYLFVFASLIFGGQVSAQKKKITVEDFTERNTFSVKSVPQFFFMNDGEHYTYWLDKKILKSHLLAQSESSLIFDGSRLNFDIQDYSFSADERKLLLYSHKDQIYRYSFSSDVYVLDLNTNVVKKLCEEGKVMYPQFNPQGNKVAYVLNNDIYIKDLVSGQTKRVTKDGLKNSIINGASDWVYEEEFTITRAFEWSPDGSTIAYLKFDESQVKESSIEYFLEANYPVEYRFKYPKVGEKNSLVSAWFYNLKKKKNIQIEFPATEDDGGYFPRLKWASDQQVSVIRINRWQNELDLFLADLNTAEARSIFHESNSRYIDIHDNLLFLKGAKGFLWTSEMDGYNHLYHYSLDGKKIKQITQGKNEITQVLGVNESQSEIYYQISDNDGLDRKIYRSGIDGNEKTCIACESGTNDADMSPGGKYFIVNHSTSYQLPKYFIVDRNSRIIKKLEDNQSLQSKLVDYDLADVEHLRIANRLGDSLNAILIKPSNFDPNKKYPVLMNVYGGPGSQLVLNKWNSFKYTWWFSMLASDGYLIFISDNRGTGGRGEEFKKQTYLHLGKMETEDQTDAALYLKTLPFVDGDRIGIFGWSYGGYMSSLCLLKSNDVFKSAISVAPVTHWKWYDSVYSERYMKDEKQNGNGFAEYAPVLLADRLKGNYMLVHGMGDDNVHFQHSAEMINALVRNNKSFDLYVYPNRSHGISGDKARLHLFSEMTRFVKNKI
ncbi:MAG TPA: S9 family peptidase [Saprospiraceae bacterium]|nr:S9 family peptidase [Saprospiraceae bacterium]